MREELRKPWWEAPLRVAAWLGGAVCAWTLVLAWDVSSSRGASLSGETLALLVSMSARLSLLGSLALAGPHLLGWATRRWRRGKWVLSLTAVMGLAIWPARDQALFLTAGDGIAAHEWVTWIRIALGATLVLGLAAIWVWHRFGIERSDHPRWWWVAWTVLGVGALGVAYRVTTQELDFYAYFGTFCVAVAWWLSSSLPYPAVAGSRKASLAAAAVGAGLVLGTVSSLPADPSSVPLEGARMASFTRSVLGIHGEAPVAGLDFGDPARFACRATSSATQVGSMDIPASRRRNVILVSVDALRKDMLDEEHQGQPLMPHLRSFGDRSVRFENAFSTYPATLFAVAGALTGMSPSELLLAPSTPDNVLKRSKGRFDRRRIFLPSTRWFEMDVIEEFLVQGLRDRRHEDAAELTNATIEHLRSTQDQGESTLTWVHYFAPHLPYTRHEEFDFGDSRRARYLSEVAHVDHELGRLLDYLRDEGWLEDSLIIVFSDHGQALGERDYFGHHVYLNGWIIDIPLIVHYPGAQPQVVKEVVEITDIAPTILDFAELEAPKHLGSRSLLAALGDPMARPGVSEAFAVRGEELFERAEERIEDLDDLLERKAELHEAIPKYDPLVAIVDERWRLVVNRKTFSRRLYDRTEDPAETNSLHEERPEVVERLEAELARWHEQQSERIYCRVIARERG